MSDYPQPSGSYLWSKSGNWDSLGLGDIPFVPESVSVLMGADFRFNVNIDAANDVILDRLADIELLHISNPPPSRQALLESGARARFIDATTSGRVAPVPLRRHEF